MSARDCAPELRSGPSRQSANRDGKPPFCFASKIDQNFRGKKFLEFQVKKLSDEKNHPISKDPAFREFLFFVVVRSGLAFVRLPLSSELSTNNAVKAGFWSWLEPYFGQKSSNSFKLLPPRFAAVSPCVHYRGASCIRKRPPLGP